MPNSVESLLTITQRNLKAYGEEVVEQRAVPDFRDGLKPVHRFILWACYGLGLKHGTPFRKAARTVGEVIGKYSPHGDQTTYDAMVGLTGTKSDDGKVWITKNQCVPLIEGYGNWGDNIDNAAAMRYTEARLSEFSTLYMLDPTYLAVVDYVPNFSEDEKVPIVLPAKLPVLLLNGSVSIAFGVSAECPSFAMEGVVQLVRRCLEGENLSPLDCAKVVVFEPVYGGDCISDKKEVLEFFKNGCGSLKFLPTMVVDTKKKMITVTSACPGLTSQTSWQTLALNLSAMQIVKSVSDSTGRAGFKFEITAQRGVDFDEFVDKITSMLVRKQSYDIGVTERELKGVEFGRTTVPSILKDWCAWRVEIEIKVIKYLIGLDRQKLKRLELMLLAVNHLKIIMDSLTKEDSAAYLVKTLKITLEDANTILDLKVRQLKSLEAAKLKATIKSTEASITSLTRDLKKPQIRILKDLQTIKV